MKTPQAAFFLISFLIFSFIASAQPCNTDADKDCNGIVNITELNAHINAWYMCSACVPDLFQAIEAYYGIIHCVPDCTGKECGDDGCGGSCGVCDESYYCNGTGQCVETPPAFPQDYVSWWKFEQETVGITPDETGRNNGSLMGDASIVSDAIREDVLGLDGSGDYVDVANEAMFDFASGDFAVSAWVNLNTGCCDAYAGVVSKWGPNSNSGWSFEFEGTTEKIRLAVRTAAWDRAISDSALPANQWMHVLGQLKGSTLEVYVNGVLQQTTGTLSGSRVTNDRTINMGREQDDYAVFDGYIDDVIIFNRSLTQTEINQIMSIGIECSDIGDCSATECYTLLACDPEQLGGYDYYDSKGCAYNYNDSASCDTLYCKIGQTCLSGSCQGGSDRDCSETPDIACTDDVCDELMDVCENIANDSKCNAGEICDVLFDCIPDPCYGIDYCSNYTDSVNCNNNPCEISGGCQWNLTSGQCELAPVDMCNSISQFGITWTFDKSYPCGQFTNNDWWVVGPLTIIIIDPVSTDIAGRVMHGSMINPSPTLGAQGYDSSMVGPGFNPSLNVARPNGQDLSSSNTLVVQPGSSLISSISITEAGYRPQLKTGAVLTVLDNPAPAGSFRPPFVNLSKDIKFNKSQLNYSLLSRLAPAASAPRLKQQVGDEQWDSVERMFERPWLDHAGGWTGAYIHPSDNMPNYGRDLSDQIGNGALMLHLDFTDQEKETLLIRFVQLGIDLYGIVQDGGQNNWAPNGGHASGRKWPILFAGLILGDPEMKAIGSRSGDYLYTSGYRPDNPPPDYVHFGEDSQTFYVQETSPGVYNYGYGGYQAEDVGLPEWGIRHSPYIGQDGKDWYLSYRRCCTANSWAGFVLAAHNMGVRDLWNHDRLFDYADRYLDIEEQLGNKGSYIRQWTRFPENMWDTYRANYGCIWTRDDGTDLYSNGYYNCFGDVNYTCEGGGSCTSGSCIEAGSCSDYGNNQRACEYDPCGLGSCNWTGSGCA